MCDRVLVALDGTPAPERALKQALDLASLTGASLAALSVEEKLPAYAASVGEVDSIRRRVKAVAVLDGRCVVGIITRGDLLRRAGMRLRLRVQHALQESDLAEEMRALAAQDTTAADVMTAPAVTVREDAAVADAVRLVQDGRFKRLPVVNADNALVGNVSRLEVSARIASGVDATPVDGINVMTHRAKRVVATDDEGRLTGMIDRASLLVAVSSALDVA